MTKPIEISAEEVKRAGGDVGAAIALKYALGQLSGKTGELDGASEKQVMAEIITALEAKGYRRPSHWEPGTRGIYMRVGQQRADFGGSDKGVPDLILIHCLTGRCALIEVKARTKGARASKEQNILSQLGAILIVRSAKEVLDVLEG